MGDAIDSTRQPTASGELTRLLLRYAEGTGVDPERLAARAGLADETVGLVDLAFLLGYREQGAFIRSFKRWEGIGPGAYRRRLREQGSD